MKHIRDKFGNIIYCIRDDGTITDKFDCDVIGHIKKDRITDEYDINTLYRIRPDGTITDKYDCDIIGNIREDGSITDKYDLHTHGKIDGYSVPSHNSEDASETGCLTVIFDIILVLLGFILKLLRPIFLVFYLPQYVSFTLYGLICVFLAVIFGLTGIIPLVCIFMAIAAIFYFLFFPYWVILILQKLKKRLSWKEVCSFYWKWFIKGPFAYPELAKMLEEKQSMSKVVAAINKVSGWLKKIFTKKPKD